MESARVQLKIRAEGELVMVMKRRAKLHGMSLNHWMLTLVRKELGGQYLAAITRYKEQRGFRGSRGLAGRFLAKDAMTR